MFPLPPCHVVFLFVCRGREKCFPYHRSYICRLLSDDRCIAVGKRSPLPPCHFCLFIVSRKGQMFPYHLVFLCCFLGFLVVCRGRDKCFPYHRSYLCQLLSDDRCIAVGNTCSLPPCCFCFFVFFVAVGNKIPLPRCLFAPLEPLPRAPCEPLKLFKIRLA